MWGIASLCCGAYRVLHTDSAHCVAHQTASRSLDWLGRGKRHVNAQKYTAACTIFACLAFVHGECDEEIDRHPSAPFGPSGVSGLSPLCFK